MYRSEIHSGPSGTFAISAKLLCDADPVEQLRSRLGALPDRRKGASQCAARRGVQPVKLDERKKPCSSLDGERTTGSK